jgi:hypothetical protein
MVSKRPCGRNVIQFVPQYADRGASFPIGDTDARSATTAAPFKPNSARSGSTLCVRSQLIVGIHIEITRSAALPVEVTKGKPCRR